MKFVSNGHWENRIQWNWNILTFCRSFAWFKYCLRLKCQQFGRQTCYGIPFVLELIQDAFKLLLQFLSWGKEMFIGNVKLKETNLGVAQAFFVPQKRPY